MNYCCPGRLHIVRSDSCGLYVTLWLWGRRFHWCSRVSIYDTPHPNYLEDLTHNEPPKLSKSQMKKRKRLNDLHR